MTSISNGEDGLSVRTKLNAALAVTDAVSFATRAAFVSANTANPGIGLSDGQIAVAGGYQYLRLASSSAIADLAGWVPNGDVYLDHFKGAATTDQGALALAWAYAASVGKVTHMSARLHTFTAPLTLNLPNSALAGGLRTGLVGAGSGKTLIQPSAGITAGQFMLTIDGPAWFQPGVNANFLMEGIEFNGLDYTRNGYRIRRHIDSTFRDVKVWQCDLATEWEDVVGLQCYNVANIFNVRGLYAHPSAGLIGISDAGSPPNEILMSGCYFRSNRQYGVWQEYGTEWTWAGGAIEGNGLNATYARANRWDMRISNGGYNGGCVVTTVGLHQESSGGRSAVWIEHGDYPATYCFNMDFVNNGATDFCDNMIRFDTTGASDAVVLTSGCNFWGVNGYTADAARRVIAEGTVTGTRHKFAGLETNTYWSTVDAPVTTLPRAEFSYVSGANGESWRFPSGLQICKHTHTAVPTNVVAGAVFDNGANLTWTYPQTFAVGTKAVVSGNGGSSDRWLGVGLTDNTAAIYRVIAHSSSGANVSPELQATGRWN